LHPAQVPTQPFLTAPYLHSPHTTGGPRNFALNQPRILIGRDERAGICIDETFANWESVSREHAWIIRQGEQVIIEDNNSMNGITVNGRRTRRNLLKDGWRLEIGGVAFVFHAGREVAEPRQEHNTRSAQ
jgi:pSer/pThr/pTyr-binding forkhead associated (FHA) protein